jgi:type I restriction enzyme S subunit
VPGLGRDDYNRIEVPIAPLPEQQRIIRGLDEQLARLDAAVVALKRVQGNLKRYRGSVLKAACEGRLVPTEAELARAEGRDYETGEQLLARILKERRAKWEADQLAKMRAAGKPPKDEKWKAKYPTPSASSDSDLSVQLEGWCAATLEQLTSAVRVICYGILMPKANIPDGVPYVRVKDLKGDAIDVPGLRKTSPEIADQYARASLRGGDLLLAIRGTFGRVAEVPDSLNGANITQDTARLDVHPDANHRYVAVHLRGAACQSYFKKVARGVAVKGVNIGDVRLTPIMLPPAVEQRRIVAEAERRLSVIDEVEGLVEVGLKRADRLRQAILTRAFEGKLVPQDPNDEPAGALLERIGAERAKLDEAAKPAKGRMRRPSRRSAKTEIFA